MATTVVMTDLVIQPGGYIDVVWNDGSTSQYQNLDRLTEQVTQHDNNQDLTKAMAVAWLLARQPTLSPITVLQNEDFTFDLSDPNPIKIQ